MPHSQPTAPQQTVCKFHLDPKYHIFHWWSTILGDSTLWEPFTCSSHSICRNFGKVLRCSLLHWLQHALLELVVLTQRSLWPLIILNSYTLNREYRVMRNRYSRLLFTSEDRFGPICAYKKNQRIWRHNARASRSRDVTDHLWWRHNAKSEKTVVGDNGEMSDRWLFSVESCVQDIK